MAGIHTLTYPSGQNTSTARLEFAEKLEGPSGRRYTVDMSDFLADAGTSIDGVAALADASLQINGVSWTTTSLSFLLSGGVASTPLPMVEVSVSLADGDTEEFEVTQPIVADADALLANAITFDGMVVTFNGAPVTFSPPPA